MSLQHPWVLILLVLPLLWLALEWRRSPSRPRLLLKTLAISAILLALAMPHWQTSQTKVAVAVLADTSASITPADLTRASQLAGQIESSRGRHWTRVLPFAGVTRAALPEERKSGWHLRSTTGEAGRATDIEAAVRDGLASLPSGMVPRLVLISDGHENRGAIGRAIWQAQQLNVPIDTYALAGRPQPKLKLESVSIPGLAFTGERFPIDILVSAPRAASATVEIAAEGKPLGRSEVKLQTGQTPLRVYASVGSLGAIDLSGAIRSAELGDVQFEQAIHLRRPKALYLTQDPPGMEKHLMGTLQAAQFETRMGADWGTTPLANYQLVIFNNYDLEGLSTAKKEQLEEYVKQGGGLLVIGGEHNVYAENRKTEDALERALPAKLAPPRSPEGTVVVLIIDKSSSMEGRKMELARLAAIGVIENLRPVDQVGVLIFDNSFQWAVPIRKAEDRTLIKRLVAGITPDGGTQIAPALSEAYRRVSPTNATYKHVVLLTDGISEEGDSIALSREAAEKKVTISTVGLGQDVNRAYLEKVASFSKGKSYFLNDPSGLEQILLKDVMEHTGSTTVEKPLVPVIAKQDAVLEGAGFDAVPPLKGYVRFIAKPTADTILKIDEKEPLLSRWQYGLGRSAVFTSDAKSRWATQWVSWPGFDKFWANVLRDLLPHTQAGEARAEYDPATGNLLVEYRLAAHTTAPERVPDIFVFGPDGYQQPIPITRAGTGIYRGQLPIQGRQGLFRVRPLVETTAFPEIGLYRQEDETSTYGANEALLRQVAEATGGRFQPNTGSVFDSGGRAVESTVELWPGLLGLAVVLSLAELLLRKWRTLARRQEAPGMPKAA